MGATTASAGSAGTSPSACFHAEPGRLSAQRAGRGVPRFVVCALPTACVILPYERGEPKGDQELCDP
jgi:hypothetical protein